MPNSFFARKMLQRKIGLADVLLFVCGLVNDSIVKIEEGDNGSKIKIQHPITARVVQLANAPI